MRYTQEICENSISWAVLPDFVILGSVSLGRAQEPAFLTTLSPHLHPAEPSLPTKVGE